MYPNNNGDSKYASQQAYINGSQQPSSQWTTGLCGCFEDTSSCMTTCCCPFITFGRNAEIIDRGRTTCASAGLIFYLLNCCAFMYSCTYRTKLRGLYSLPEEPCKDCCVHYFCVCCALCQEYRELKNRGLDPAIGWTANAEKINQNGKTPPYVVPGMDR
ncbi:PLAC8 motif-containing protein [Trema orientale]|uniref:PLAC8 motif-containing protein n=1 Tax=Trema orientale TaxID=63057 RepID=A0A2P5ELL4_TREOI|nr:PLAC8 motif-containing protein [Trema orientale]